MGIRIGAEPNSKSTAVLCQNGFLMNQTTSAAALAKYWRQCRTQMPKLPPRRPKAWSFGATPAHADELLALVLAGIKTGTASALWELEFSGETLPQIGELSIILDGAHAPGALIETVDIAIVPFNKVTAEHAAAEGEGDRSLEYWRESHERFWRQYSSGPRGFARDMPIVCERFQLLLPPAQAGRDVVNH